MGEADRLQEPGEPPDVAGQSLRPDLLIEVQAGVVVESARRIGCADHQRQQPDPQRPIEVEARQFRGHERMQRAMGRASAQQVYPAAPELAGARSGQHEARRRRLLQDRVDYREQLRDSLHLVDHHGPRPGPPREQLPQALGTGAQAAVQRRVEQVHEQRVRQPIPQPRGLAGPAGTEQEAASIGDPEKSTDEFHFVSKNGNKNSIFILRSGAWSNPARYFSGDLSTQQRSQAGCIAA